MNSESLPVPETTIEKRRNDIEKALNCRQNKKIPFNVC